MRSASEQNARTTETGVFEEERQDGVDDEYGGKASEEVFRRVEHRRKVIRRWHIREFFYG